MTTYKRQRRETRLLHIPQPQDFDQTVRVDYEHDRKTVEMPFELERELLVECARKD